MKEKCICEICTCGKHRCPHRPNVPFAVDDDHLGAVSAYHKEKDSQEDSKEQSKQWQAASEEKIIVNDSYHNQDNKENINKNSQILTTPPLVKMVQDSGSGQPQGSLKHASNNIHDSLSQVSKTLSIRPKENLRPCGEMDLYTIHQQDYIKRNLEKLPYNVQTRQSGTRETSICKPYTPKSIKQRIFKDHMKLREQIRLPRIPFLKRKKTSISPKIIQKVKHLRKTN
ncbi:uncharacterized protein LOC143231775 [Tachypleus tridentatus]|uniref:uncharacterized protein LOC143231775 n=1 Tax=Tachypleus tridentatus TaxID=6853 RepID=UPI003FD3A1FB